MNTYQHITELKAPLKVLNTDEQIKLDGCKTTLSFKKGDRIYEEGALINGVYCIDKGVCKLTKKEQIIRLAGSGDILGLQSIIAKVPVNTSTYALETMQVNFIPSPLIIELLEQNKLFSLNALNIICKEFQDASNLLVNMAQKNVRQRLACTLLNFKDTFGTDEDAAININLSREELASIIGTAPENCIRLLSEFTKENIIQLYGKKIIIKNPTALLKISK
ncbi:MULTISPECIES: Crp/Fnr family transcriptional regulator [unclassified Flavobacterium]|uniref:Crp/Fnr family transcriptional regulator n=1 Tax=unclassified Flavobacterium TaxID=196869 RepID=UPI00095E1775|nr:MULTISPECIES: Crp/Fnr family transcriptional regulator [unclassified Flavobacterium]MBN9284436.1 Crp/Fnr family transcriptional regulator [Flavobacterium sp.]OJV72738.1 MAG: hypothetical protein BGO42_15000 [Flavobacterium sp. 40-81]